MRPSKRSDYRNNTGRESRSLQENHRLRPPDPRHFPLSTRPVFMGIPVAAAPSRFFRFRLSLLASASQTSSVASRCGLHGDLTWRALRAAVRAVPWFLESPLILGWAGVVFLTAGRQRRAIMGNLRALLPEASLFRRALLTWRTFYQFGCVTVDGIRYQQGEEVIAWEVTGGEHCEAAAAQSRPVILLTAHMGSYDAAGAVFARRMDRRLTAVRAPERDACLQELRRESLSRLEDSRFRMLYNSSESVLGVELLRALADGEWVALQADRALEGLSTMRHEDGERVWLLPRGPFMLAAAARAVCLPTFIRRTGPRRYQVEFHAPLTSPPGARGDAASQSLATRWTELFTGVYRRDPSQWLVFEPAFARPDEA